jgi:hypothetical protein
MDVVLKSNVLHEGALRSVGEHLQVSDTLAADLQKRGLAEAVKAAPVESKTETKPLPKKKSK